MVSKTPRRAANWSATAGTSSLRPKSLLGTLQRLPAMKQCNTSSRYIKLLKQLIGGFQLMMIAGAVLCFIAGPLDSPVDLQTIYLGVVLIVVVLSTGLFAFYQEAQVDAVMAGFKALTPSRANVVRDGQVYSNSLFATEFQFTLARRLSKSMRASLSSATWSRVSPRAANPFPPI